MLLPGASTGDAALLQRLERMERRMDIAGDIGAAEQGSALPRAAVMASRPAVQTPVAPQSPQGSAELDEAGRSPASVSAAVRPPGR